jgi:hypothetical protein
MALPARHSVQVSTAAIVTMTPKMMAASRSSPKIA